MPSDELISLITRLRSSWIPVTELHDLLQKYFTPLRSNEEIEQYRLGKGRNFIKKLRDEIVPVNRFLKATQAEGEVRFELSDNFPDCWLRLGDGELRGLEITRAHAAEQVWLARQLNKEGRAGGFIGLPLGATEAEYQDAFERETRCYSPEMVLNWVRAGVLDRLEKKSEVKYQGFELLIEAKMGNELLDNQKFEIILPDLIQAAKGTPFSRIHLIGNESRDTAYFCLK